MQSGEIFTSCKNIFIVRTGIFFPISHYKFSMTKGIVTVILWFIQTCFLNFIGLAAVLSGLLWVYVSLFNQCKDTAFIALHVMSLF